MRTFAVIAIATFAGGCDRATPLAGAVAIGPSPVQVTFATPITPASVDRAVCFEFNPPGESQRAAQISVVLLTSQGERDSLRSRPDRTGEATVCLRDTSAAAPTRTYASAEFVAAAPLRVHQVFWGASTIRR